MPRICESHVYSPGGINVKLRTLNSFLTWLHEEGHTPERHRVRLLRAPKKVVTPLSDVEVRRIIAFKLRGSAIHGRHPTVNRTTRQRQTDDAGR